MFEPAALNHYDPTYDSQLNCKRVILFTPFLSIPFLSNPLEKVSRSAAFNAVVTVGRSLKSKKKKSTPSEPRTWSEKFYIFYSTAKLPGPVQSDLTVHSISHEILILKER